MKYKNNCYGFVKSALEGNSTEDCFSDIGDIEIGEKIFSGINNGNATSDEIFEIIQGGKYLILELLETRYQKDSQHVALLNTEGLFSDQNGPDGDIRINKNLDNLLEEYKDVYGCSYYNIYSLKNSEQEKNIVKFLKDFE